MPLVPTNSRKLVNTFGYPIDTTTQSFGGFTSANFTLDPLALCDVQVPDDFHSSINDTFNCNLCPNDVPYYQYYVKGDKTYIYFEFDDSQSTDITNPDHGWNNTGNVDILISARLLDLDSVEVFAKVDLFCSKWMNGYRSDTNMNFQVLEIDTSLINETCWILEFTLQKLASTEVFFSEPYREINCEETVLVEGVFETEDCSGRFYGLADTFFGNANFAYQDKYRVPANIEKDNFELEREITTDSRVISTQKIENYLFRSQRLPEYEADKLINSFSAKTLNLDSLTFTEIQGYSKNNDNGSMWIVSVELGIKKEQLKFGCN